MPKKQTLLFGAHMSIAGEFKRAIERGESIGCTAIQIFTKSNRQWHAKAIGEKEAMEFKESWKASSITSIVAHASYLINIGSPDKAIEHKSVNALKIEMERCAMLDIPYLVLHPGSHSHTDEKICLERISHNLDELFKQVDGCSILLETSAGQGTNVGYNFEQLAYIIKLSHHKNRLGVCFDTCHAFTAGYDFTTEKSYHDLWKQFDKIIGLNKLKAIHVNDSKQVLGSCIDRHADIGKGKMGLKPFELLFNDPQFFDIPKILETPKKDGLEKDKKNMETLVSLLSSKTKKALHVTREES
ncbi:MAG TPA: deoxyribonuclease IV [Candidatus Babeliales bacterium]|nr:deoxyribonuclease IV [Candidatus Babeliales bacterium]